jgi:hypothetical protein
MSPAATTTPTTAPRPELVGIVPEVPPLRGIKLPTVAERLSYHINMVKHKMFSLSKIVEMSYNLG